MDELEEKRLSILLELYSQLRTEIMRSIELQYKKSLSLEGQLYRSF